MVTPTIPSCVSVLLKAYDSWVDEEHPGASAKQGPLLALQQALHEYYRRGSRLASIPLLLERTITIPSGKLALDLNQILPHISPDELLLPCTEA